MPTAHVAVIGAGMAGLAAALELAVRGARTTVIEQASHAGGKLRQVQVAGHAIDSGPTVFTMRGIFEELFALAGRSLESSLPLQRAQILARHAWSDSERLDLFAEPTRTAEAIGTFAGAREARRYLEFTRDARRIFQTLERPYLRAERCGPLRLARRIGLRHLTQLLRIRPFDTLWHALGSYFHDPRLRQLFARYSTYCGSSPFQAPATLMLIAHVEQDGVWLVEGGMQRLADTVTQLARAHGVEFRFDTEVTAVPLRSGRVTGLSLASGEFIPAHAVIVNADVDAVAAGRFGQDLSSAVTRRPPSLRSLSAVTWSLLAETSGFPLLRHTVFFSPDYAAEFQQICQQRQLPVWPTVYVCAQDRPAHETAAPGGPERLLCLINAPADGDARTYDPAEIDVCASRTFTFLERCGLTVHRQPQRTVTTTPQQFERLFPATGGCLYGQSTHGWRASFSRPGSRTRIPGLYLAGGSVHPGPGLPLAVLSGRLAAQSVLDDLDSLLHPHPVATRGGISTL